MEHISIREFIKNFDAGTYEDYQLSVQISAGWYDWFCRDTSLRNKTRKLGNKLKMILASPKINQDTMYVLFKNNCPMSGSLYDDFRICDLETKDVIFTVVPSCGHYSSKGIAYVWGRENQFDKPLVQGSWKDIKNFFIK